MQKDKTDILEKAQQSITRGDDGMRYPAQERQARAGHMSAAEEAWQRQRQ